MKPSNYANSKSEQQFQIAVVGILTLKISSKALARLKKAMGPVKNNSNKMHWVVCIICGVRNGSTYAQGVKRLRTRVFAQTLK